MTEVKIRQIGLADVEELQAISCETYEATFGADNPRELMEEYLAQAYDLNKLKRELGTEGTYFYFLEVDGKTAGYLKLNVGQAQSEPMEPDNLEIERIYLRTAYQGKGLAGKLLTKAEEMAQALGKNRIWLGVWERNYRAQKFYAKHGFSRFSEHFFMMGDDAQTDYLLAKQL